jgi:hypothetical protein
MNKTFHLLSLLSLLVFLSGCGKTDSHEPAPPTGEKIKLALNLKAGDLKKITVGVDSESKIQAAGKEMVMTMNIVTVMALEVLEVNADGEHLIKSTYEKMSMDMDGGPMKMSFDSSNPQESESPMAEVFSSIIGQHFTIRMSNTGKTLAFEVAEGMNPLIKQQIEQTMQNFSLGMTFPDFEVDNGDSWESSITQDMNAIKVTNVSTNTLLDQSDGLATIGVAGVMEGSMNGTSSGTIKIDLSTGWIDSGEISTSMLMEQLGNEVETEIKVTFSGK